MGRVFLMAKGKLIKNKAIYQKLFLEYSRARSKPKADKKKKERYLWKYNDLYESREFSLNAFKSGIFPLNQLMERELEYQH